jgi:hypothetical protein
MARPEDLIELGIRNIRTSVTELTPDYSFKKSCSETDLNELPRRFNVASDVESDPIFGDKNFVFYYEYGFLLRDCPEVREHLADKVLCGRKLTMPEKQEIAYFLTGRPVHPPKKGRPSTNARDFFLAMRWYDEKKTRKGQPSIIRDRLIKEFGLENSENSFYMAVKRGLEIGKKRVLSDLEILKKLRMEYVDSEAKTALIIKFWGTDDIDSIENSLRNDLKWLNSCETRDQ